MIESYKLHILEMENVIYGSPPCDVCIIPHKISWGVVHAVGLILEKHLYVVLLKNPTKNHQDSPLCNVCPHKRKSKKLFS